jgi:hypothetical protein
VFAWRLCDAVDDFEDAKAESSTTLNSFQQARRISLKQNALEKGIFAKSQHPPWVQWTVLLPHL